MWLKLHFFFRDTDMVLVDESPKYKNKNLYFSQYALKSLATALECLWYVVWTKRNWNIIHVQLKQYLLVSLLHT